MAVTQNTLIGRTRNSIGGVTMTTWKGLNVAKSKAISVANPRTQDQVAQRNKLTRAVDFYRHSPGFFERGFKQLAIHKSSYNAFIGENMKNGTFDGLEINIDTLVPSKGSLFPPTTQSGVFNANKSISLTWSTTLVGDQKQEDRGFVAVYAGPDGAIVYIYDGVIARGQGGTSLTSPVFQNYVAGELYYALYFESPDGKISDSSFHRL